jgi:hypothetical protein
MKMIEDKIQKYRGMYFELKPLLEQMKKLEKEIKSEILGTGKVPEVKGVVIQIRKGYLRSSWNDKSLRGYAAANPEILEFVKETQVKPSVSIRLT